MTERESQERASTAKQIARSSETTPDINDYAVCYRVITGLDPDDIIAEHKTAINGHPELLRLRISSTTHRLLTFAVELAQMIDDYKTQIVDEDAERVMAYVNGDTQYCPDRSQLMTVLNQYGIVLSKVGKSGCWKEMTYGGMDFELFFNRDELGSRIGHHLKRIERDADKMDKVKKIQVVGFAGSQIVFLLWTDNRNVRYIAYANRDWSPISPVEFGGVNNG